MLISGVFNQEIYISALILDSFTLLLGVCTKPHLAHIWLGYYYIKHIWILLYKAQAGFDPATYLWILVVCLLLVRKALLLPIV